MPVVVAAAAAAAGTFAAAAVTRAAAAVAVAVAAATATAAAAAGCGARWLCLHRRWWQRCCGRTGRRGGEEGISSGGKMRWSGLGWDPAG